MRFRPAVVPIVWIMTAVWAGSVGAEAPVADMPVNTVGAAMEHWTVLGPFSNPPAESALAAGSGRRQGFERDYLTVLGGERHAVILPGTAFDTPAPAPASVTVTVQALSVLTPGGMVDLHDYFPNVDYAVAYAFAYLDSPRAQTVDFFLGSDDSPRVWVNQDLVLDHWTGGRGLRAREDHFRARLNKGLNRVLVKIEQGWGDWQFVLEVFDPEGLVKLEAENQVAGQLREFQNQTLAPQSEDGFLLKPGPFPAIDWSRPADVERLVGRFPLQVLWFDAKLREVRQAEKPGRYLAYVQGECPIGFTVRRALTFYCRPADWNPGTIKTHVELETPDAKAGQRWREQAAVVDPIAAEQFRAFLTASPRGAALLAYLDAPDAGLKTAPVMAARQSEIMDAELQLVLKRRLLDLPVRGKTLKPPQPLRPRAPVLRAGKPKDAGVKPEAAALIRKACQAWFAETREPFSVLVARRGVIVIHEAFGPGVKPETPFEIASIAKTLTGSLFAQFMDQDLIALEDPVGKFTPDFPVSGDRVITLRMCFTHTTGLEGWERWGNVSDPWLENVVANGLTSLRPGRQYVYGNTGFHLAGKIMEIAGRKTIWRLLGDNLLQPLGMTHTEMRSISGWTRSTAEDMAKFGQMLLNRGAYGDRRYFSAAVFEQILPRKLREFYPAVAASCGIGLEWMRTADPRAGQNGVPADQTLLGPRTFGHGSGSGSVFRVDPEHELVVVQLRNETGANYDRHLAEFLQAIENGLAEKENQASARAASK